MNQSRTVVLLLLSAGLLLMPAAGYGQAALTNDSVVKLVKAGLGEEVIVSMVNLQPATYTLTPDSLIALKKDGVSDKIIAAMLNKSSASTGATPAAGASTAEPKPANFGSLFASGPAAAVPTEIGVYFKKNNAWVEVPPEVVNTKTGGVLKRIATANVVKGDVNGTVKGAHSRNVVAAPLEFLIRAADGVAITEYQLIHLNENKDEREFRAATGGVFHSSTGATRDEMEFEGNKIAERTFVVTLPNNLGTGEYGFLPPGGENSNAPSRKIYSFRIMK